MHRAHWSRESTQKVGIPLLPISASLILTDATESNVWTQFSRWLGIRVWSHKEDNQEAAKVDNKQEDPERGQQQRGTNGTTFPQFEPQEQTAQNSVKKGPVISNSQAKDKLEDLEEEIVIMRNTKADAPNITFNRPKNVGRRELYLVATFGIVLQLGVLLFFGLITYYSTLRYQKDGRTVVAYACPLAVIGTVVLALGMLLCSHVVDGTTREDRYEAVRGKTTQMIWLQQETTVSDQLFSSVALFPPQTSKVVTTSSRVLTENPTEHGMLQKTIIETKAIIGTAVALLGFIIQFIGLRGMHWSASIAQLIALAIMTALRAWVRRGFTDELCSKRLSQSYELDWLALNLGDPEHVFWSKSNPNPALETERTWKIAAGGNESQYEALQPRHTKSQPEAQGEEAECSTISNRFNAQGIMTMRRNLAKLTNWHGPAREQAIRLTHAIEVVMNSLFAPARLEADDQEIQRFLWPLYVEGGPEGRECIQLHVDRDNDNRTWKAYADEVEAILSLWLYSNQSSAQKPEDQKSQSAEAISTSSNVEDDTWLRAKGLGTQLALRRIGPYTRELHRDLGWWIPDGPFNLLKVIEPASGGKGRSMKLEEVDRHMVTVCDDSSEKSNQVTVSSKKTRRFVPKPIPYYTEPLTKRVNLADDWVGLSQESHTEMSSLAVESYDTIDKLHALDLLSAFMWAAAKTLKTPIDNHSDLQHSDTSSERTDMWKLFTLKSKSLSNLAQSIHDTGLGSLQDVYLSIVPPLSINHKLPELDAVVELVSQRANKRRKSRHWVQACNEYIWLSRLGGNFPPSSLIYSKATALLLQYLRTLVHYRKSIGFQYDRPDGDSFALDEIESVIETIQRRHGEIHPDVLSSLHLVQQKMQNNFLEIKDWLLLSPRCKNFEIMHFTETHRWAIRHEKWWGCLDKLNRQEIETPDVMGWRPLHYTTAMEISETTELLLEQGADPNVRDIWGCTPMHYLPPLCSERCLRYLEAYGGDVNAVSTENRTPLHYSALRGDLDVTETLLREKANTRIRDIDGRTPIHLAAIHGRADIVTLLPGDVEIADDRGLTPLHLAALNGQVKVAEKLVQIDGNLVNLRDNGDRMPIHSAVLGGSIDITKLLLSQESYRRRINFAAKRHHSFAPLHIAAEKGNVALIGELIANGADVTLEASGKERAIHFAAQSGSLQAFKMCRSIHDDTHIRDGSGKTPIFWAVKGGSIDVVEFLIEHGASVNDVKDDGSTSLYAAVKNGDLIMIKVLLKAGAVVEKEDGPDETPLVRAVRDGNAEIVKTLLEASVDSIRQASLNNLLHEASNHDITKMFLDAGADANSVTKGGERPLFTAVMRNDLETTKLLLQAGAEVDAPDDRGETMLSYAAKYGHEDMVKFLLKTGADPNASFYRGGRNKLRGNKPIYSAAKNAEMEIAKLLLEAGASLDTQDHNEERSPLDGALYNDDVELAKFLLKAGADPNPVLNTAIASEKLEMVELLLEAGACANAHVQGGRRAMDVALRGHAAHKYLAALIRHGADVNITDGDNETALHKTARIHHNQAMEVLIRSGINVNTVNIDGETALDVSLDPRHLNDAGARILEKAGGVRGLTLKVSSKSSE